MLYLVATPIGNLSEITYRAVEVLQSADVIYAEDTRHSLPLLTRYNIKKPLFSYQKFNERARAAEIIERLKNGQTVAVISDAGTPLISDPGAALVIELIKNGLEFTAVSGASAVINAFVLSGFNAPAFTMLGFLPAKNKDRQRIVDSVKNLPHPLIFYVAPHDVLAELGFLHSALGSRRYALCRELTKKFEEVIRGTLGEEADITLKGEMVLVIEGAAESDNNSAAESLEEYLKSLKEAGFGRADAVKEAAKALGLPKNQVYKKSLRVDFR